MANIVFVPYRGIRFLIRLQVNLNVTEWRDGFRPLSGYSFSNLKVMYAIGFCRASGFRPLSGYSFSNLISHRHSTLIQWNCFRPLSGYSFSNLKNTFNDGVTDAIVFVPYRGIRFLIACVGQV